MNAFIRMFKHRVVNYCTLEKAALDTYSRCDHYNNFKSLLTVETYLTLDIQLKYRIAMPKFRLSNHRLNIELGRYNNVLKENRMCNVCQQLNNTHVIDCEYHAFYKCVKYDTVRQMYLFNWYIHSTESQDFFVLLSSQNPGIVKMYLFISINLCM